MADQNKTDGGGEGRSGGTFCQFRVGRVGTSGAHMRYISRESAVREREGGCLLYGMPKELWELWEKSHLGAEYEAFRLSLIAHAWTREASETSKGTGSRSCRTHYRATLSFERDVGSETAKRLVGEWLSECFPFGSAAAFVHRDTAYLHVHVWLDARGSDGKKLNFPASDYRKLDERWNRLYAPAVGKDVQEHLRRKREKGGQINNKKQRDRGGGGGHRDRKLWRQWELDNAGRRELKKVRSRGDKRRPSSGARSGDQREHLASRGKRAARKSTLSRKLSARAARRAVSEAHRLREELARLGQREKQREKDQGREEKLDKERDR